MAGLKRIVLVTNIPTPYRIPLFNELDRQLTAAGYSLYVIFAGLGYSRRKWQIDLNACAFSCRVLQSNAYQLGKNAERVSFLYAGLGKVLDELAPDLVIVPGFSVATLKALWFSLKTKCPYVIWTGSTGDDVHLQQAWRRMLRRQLSKHAVAAIGYGSKAAAYLRTLGMRAEQVFIAINTVDTSFFKQATQDLRSQSVSGYKKHLTYIGALSTRKNVMRLLEVVHILLQSRNDFVVDIIGTGEEEEHLKQFVEAREMDAAVAFWGYQQKEELPQFLARSNVFLFQTDYDVWGLVLNEAMAAGVLCLASRNAGASADLIQNGQTGFTVDFSDAKTSANRINWVLDNPGAAHIIGNNASRFMAAHANLQVSAEGFVKAVQYALQQKN